jgi:YVTN family beta-propeller protein
MTVLLPSTGLARISIVVIVCALALTSGLAGSFLVTAGHAPTAGSHVGPASFRASGVSTDREPSVRPASTVGASARANPAGSGAFVGRTLVLYNDTFVRGNFVPGNGFAPTGIAYDPTNGMIYVVDDLNSNVSVIDPALDKVVATIPTGSALGGIIYDSGTNEVVVADLYPTELTFIDPNTNTVSSTLAIPDGAYSLAYDSGMNELFVTPYTTENVTVVDDATEAIVTTITVGENPTSIAYDPVLDELFVSDSQVASPHLSVISDTSNSVVANVTMGATPYSLLYDSTNQDLYVANIFNVSVVSTATNQVIANITVDGIATGLAYDTARDQVWTTGGPRGNVTIINPLTNAVVTNLTLASDASGVQELLYDSPANQVWITGGEEQVTVISDATDTIVTNVTTGAVPLGLAFDSARDEVYIASFSSSSVEVVSAATGGIVANLTVGYGPNDVMYDSGRGEIFVANSVSGNVTVINDTSDTIAATLPVGIDNLAYDAANDQIFGIGDLGYGVMVINDTNNSVTATLEPSWAISGIVYDSDNGQLYLGSENVTAFNATTLATVTTIDMPGYTYRMTFDSASNQVFAETDNAQAQTNLTSISGATDTVGSSGHIGFIGDGITCDASQGTVFITSGEIVGSVDDYSIANSALVSNTTVGEEPIGVAFDPTSGEVWVANYGSGTLSVLQSGATFPVTFSETGLPAGTSWSVVFNGGGLNSTASSVVFTDPNGTYNFTVTPVPGFTAAPTSGTVTVTGAPAARTISFTPEAGTKSTEKFAITFSETGLTSGTSWSVTLNGTLQASNDGTVVFQAPNGTEAYSVSAVTGFTVTPSGGSVTVAGQPVTVALTFKATTNPSSGQNGSGSGSSSKVLGLPSAEGYLLIVLILVLLVIVAVVAMRWRKGKTPPTDPTSTGPGAVPP